MLNTIHQLLPLLTHPFFLLVLALTAGGCFADWWKGWPRG